jgi:hypothetical protein
MAGALKTCGSTVRYPVIPAFALGYAKNSRAG